MKKKMLMILAVLFLTAGCGKIPKMANGDDAVVSLKDGDNSISITELYNEIKDKYALSSLIDMIDNKILLAKYPNEEDNAKEYIEEQLASVKKYYVDDDGKYDEASLLSALKSYYGIDSIKQFEELLSLSHYRNLAVTDYAESLVTEKQIKAYYDDEVVGDIQCSHILITPDTKEDMTTEEKEKAEKAALQKAKDLIVKLNNGEDFAALAKSNSDDTQSAKEGGDLGYFNKDAMVDEFEEAAYALKVDKYTKTPVKTQYGYHIILKTGEKDKPTLADKKESIITALGKEIQSADSTIQINALVELRKTNKMVIEDSELKSQYERYISEQLISARNATTTTAKK